MINTTLFKKEFKSNYKLMLIFMAVLAMYDSMIVFMFDPKLEESLALMAQSMPQLFAAFGMLNVGATLLEFVVNYLYGFLLVVFPMVFIIICTSKLICKYVDKGSMAYLLATPNKRTKIALTQSVSLISYIFILTIFSFLTILFCCELMFPQDLDIAKFLLVNVGIFCLYIFMSGLCFMFGCLFDDTKYSIGLGTGILILSVLLQMISQVGEQVEKIKYLTPLTLFDTAKLMAGEGIWQIAVLFIGGIIMYAIGILAFSKRDLSI